MVRTIDNERVQVFLLLKPLLKKSTDSSPTPADENMSTSARSVHNAEASGFAATPPIDQLPPRVEPMANGGPELEEEEVKTNDPFKWVSHSVRKIKSVYR